MIKHVVLLARIDDQRAGATCGTFSTTQEVYHGESDSLSEIVQMAMELAPPVETWGRY